MRCFRCRNFWFFLLACSPSSQLWSHGNRAVRIEQLTNRLASVPGHVASIVERAQLLMEEQCWDEALFDLELAIRLSPAETHGKLHFQRAQLLKQAGCVSQAAAVVQAMLQQSPEAVQLWEFQAWAMARLNRPAECVVAVDKVLAKSVRASPDLLVMRLRAAEQAQGAEAALAWVYERLQKTALPILEDEALRLERATKRPAAALARLERKIQQQPRAHALLLEQAEILLELNRAADALAVLNVFRRLQEATGQTPANGLALQYGNLLNAARSHSYSSDP